MNSFSFDSLTADDANRLKSSFDTFKDHLERKFLGEELSIEENPPKKKAKGQQGKLNEEEMLIATVSHEIRTPLNGIIGFADLLIEDQLTNDQKQLVKAIQSSSYNLLEIINELLDYSKLSAGLEHFDTIDFSLRKVLQDVLFLCQTLMLNKNVELKADIDTHIPEFLKGDPSKISQILLNLLSNAIKFVDQGSVRLSVHMIRERKETVWLEFIVEDTGIGISERDLKHIFDSFRQARRPAYATHGGTGLGLTIVKQLVEKLGGALEVNSRVGVGTTFRFTLPYAIGTQTEDISQSLVAHSAAEVEGLRILVFEDNLMNQRLIEQRLKAWGCHAYITENIPYGLDLLHQVQIDLVLMDLRMPLMNGFQVTRMIRQHENPANRDIPVVALTADFTVEDRNECEANGIDDYILKPFRPEELLAKIIGNLKGKQGSKGMSDKILTRGVAKEDAHVDLSKSLEECMGDLEVLGELLSLYKQNALEFIGKVQVHLEDGNFTEIRNAAHKIKCGLAMMHTYNLHYIVEQIHINCRTTRDLDHLKVLYEMFVDTYPEVEALLDEEYKKLQAKDCD